jgi:glutamyl-tRNA reductase
VHHWLAGFHGLNNHDVARHSYLLEEASVVRHVMRVGSGLDSMVLGEPQILGQLKDAYRTAVEHGTVGTVLSKLFQHTFAVAKKVRTDTAVGSSPVSVAFTAVNLARQVFGDLGQSTALLLGAGETMELAARHLAANGLNRMIVANRTVDNARRLALPYGGFAIGLDELGHHLAEADIVIASTGAPSAIVDEAMVRTALGGRRRRPMLMVDIAVPQDIEPSVGDLEDVFLYNIDDLQAVVAEGQRNREAAAEEAMEIIDVQVDQFMGWLEARATTNYIREIRNQAESQRDELLNKALKRLAAGEDPEKLLGFVANTLTNKLMHKPTSVIRDAASRSDTQLVEHARRLFGVEDKSHEP